MRSSILVAILLVSHAARADSECASPITCRPACSKGDAAACTWLGRFYTSDPSFIDGSTSDQYSGVAVELFDNACAKGSGEGCAELARLLHLTAVVTGAEPDRKRIDGLRVKACKLGHADACDDDKQRLAMLEKACTAGQAAACLAATRAYQPRRAVSNGDDPPPPEDDDSGGAGTAMALDGAKPLPIKPDPEKAKALNARAQKLFADACAHGKVRTCRAAGDQQAQRVTACKAGASEACHLLARTALVHNKPWVDDSIRACELGDFTDCGQLASAYESGANQVKPDAAKAVVYLTKGCDHHDGNACTSLGKRIAEGKDVPKDAAKAVALYQRGCDERVPYACEQAGDAALAAKDPVGAVTWFAKACDHEGKMSASYREICGELAARYEAGDGVRKDVAKAKALRAQGCAHGESKFCTP